MRPTQLKTKIFLDSGDPAETKELLNVLGFLDGQTTNPTLIAKNPQAKEYLRRGEKFAPQEIYDFYRGVVQEISNLLPNGSVSVEVYADAGTKAEDMLRQGREMFTWIPNAHVKFPIITGGLVAASQAVREGLRVNMTLCFTQEQAAAVYAATRGAAAGDVFVSPFVGRLDDIGQNGMDLIKNILAMYRSGDGHAQVLTASARSLEHFLAALQLGTDIITAPFKVLKEWADKGTPLPGANFGYMPALLDIAYHNLNINRPWTEFNIRHPLTDRGIELFSRDWNALVA